MSKVSITQIGFALLCIGSVFMYSTQITDPYIVSKWLYTILFVLIITIYCSIRMLLGKSVKFDTRLAGMSIVIVSSLQAIYGLSQCFNITTFNTFYKIMGSFENPTGFSACLCLCLPALFSALFQRRFWERKVVLPNRLSGRFFYFSLYAAAFLFAISVFE